MLDGIFQPTHILMLLMLAYLGISFWAVARLARRCGRSGWWAVALPVPVLSLVMFIVLGSEPKRFKRATGAGQ